MSVDMECYIAYQQGYEAGKRDAAPRWHRVEEPPKEYGNYLAVVNGEVMEVTYSDMRDDWNSSLIGCPYLSRRRRTHDNTKNTD